MIKFTLHMSDVKAAAKRVDRSLNSTMRNKLRAFGDTVINTLQFEAPVSTGEYLASFALAHDPDRSQPGPMGPAANKGGKRYYPDRQELNHAAAVSSMFSRYERGDFNKPYRNFHLINTAKHAAIVEYGGNSPAGFGLIDRAVRRGIASARLAKVDTKLHGMRLPSIDEDMLDEV